MTHIDIEWYDWSFDIVVRDEDSSGPYVVSRVTVTYRELAKKLKKYLTED